MALPERRLEGTRFWKLDLAVLADDDAKEILRAGISSPLVNTKDPSQEWDNLKSQWQHWARESGRNVRLRLACKLNETLRRMRIVKAGAPLTPTTREYLDVLRTRYDRTFLRSTQKAITYAQDSVLRDAPELTRFLRTRRTQDSSSKYVTSVRMPDGFVSENIADIETRFSVYFIRLFTVGDPEASTDALIKELERLCAVVSKLPAEASVNLLKAASAAERGWFCRRHRWCRFSAEPCFPFFGTEAQSSSVETHYIYPGVSEALVSRVLATTSQLLALKTLLRVLDDIGAPARPLAMFFWVHCIEFWFLEH
ncbi:hypothetical protein HPB51_025858 [Rhipicephalus microplus]|uniref:Uncharacterized protein n=1 Tax=Rhipicephalus microplus TaxID=6941 RepID=A0A9J6F8W4_RHIMP|nr:hypothetical protein HPB51_025858 [Rhipicephalus microplus]